MGHIGFTPQSEHQLGGYRVQGRGDGAEQLLADAHAVADAGAFAVVLEMVPGDLAAQVTAELDIPTVGIGAGPGCDAQVLVWQDAMGLRQGTMARFVKQYAQIGQVLEQAAADLRRRGGQRRLPGGRAHVPRQHRARHAHEGRAQHRRARPGSATRSPPATASASSPPWARCTPGTPR